MKTVKDILNKNFMNSNTINEDAMAIDAFILMETKNMDYTVVLEGTECVGIISEVDYLHKIILAQKNPNETSVKDIMTSCICSVDVKDPIHKCLELMDTFRIRHLLVFDAFSYEGVITLHDLMLSAFNESVDKLIEQEQIKYFLDSNN
jgi:signal-transduction protein with cAMP-binding, CBS, and nucleotidyltransferase domain